MNLVFFEDVDFKDIRFLMDLYNIFDMNLINTHSQREWFLEAPKI